MPLQPIRSRHIFVDESGDPNLDIENEGVSDYFVLTAVIIHSEQLEDVLEEANEIIVHFFQTGEMKSSSVGGNTPRRRNIIDGLSALSFKHYSYVIDKSEILTDSGLSYKKSFIKFIHRSLYQRLFEAYTNLTVIADEHGTSEFMLGFGRYLQKRLPQHLFETSSFQFGDSIDHPFIQFADMIAGTISRIYSGLDSIDLLKPIHPHTIIIDEWPPKSPKPIAFEEFVDEERINALIRYQAFKQAIEFIDRHTGDSDEIVQIQVAAVRYLLYHFRVVDPEGYITTSSLQSHLNNLGFQLSERSLRANIIGKLRDNNVFIVSSNKGIKIPLNTSDILRFVELVDSQVIPYLHRLELIRNHFLLASDGEWDILGEDRFPQLYQVLNN